MLPDAVCATLRTLNEQGYQAVLAGGCVRDLIMGRIPHDYDIASSALPDAVLSLFPGYAVPTGLQHGTVTVHTDGGDFEITTFRADGAYADHRHPDEVSFTDSLTTDLARRDFTVNAMAMDVSGHMTDPFGGQADIRRRLLRCVGAPEQRFAEDALRMLRALRFAATLGFTIEPETERALRVHCGELSLVAAERVREELTKLLCGDFVADVLLRYSDVLGVVLPEILPCVGFAQHNPHHCYDVWEHTARSVAAIAPKPVLRWTMLLHDVGKPACFTLDNTGTGHFFGHHQISARMAECVVNRLRFDRTAAHEIVSLVHAHDRDIQRTEKAIRRAMSQLGVNTLRRLCQVKRADTAAQSACCAERLSAVEEAERLLESLVAEDSCFSLRQLAVNGQDMLTLGLSGPAVGQVLTRLLDAVIDGDLPNERQALLDAARRP